MDLQSIFPTRKAVPFLNGTVEVSGLSLRKATHLIIEYPELLALANGQADLASLIVSAPNAALAILAQGITPGDNKALLEAFDEAPVGAQIDLLSAIIDLTFAGQRAAPFLASLAARVPPSQSLPETSAPTSPESPKT
jgi:hypothetical protein